MIAFVKPFDPKDSLPDGAGRELRPLPETEEELKALIKKAETGDMEAMCDLGHFYSVQASAKLEYFKSQISAGSPNMRAPYNIDENAPFSEVVAEERENAFRWFKKSAELGSVEGLYELSLCYRHGLGVAKHHDKAQELLLQAAHKGHAPAQYDVGMQFYFGKTDTYRDLNPDLKIKPDYVQAVSWLKKAAEQGIGLAQYQLALCYEEGTGVKKDDEKAFHWYNQAAETALVWAVLKLGECYEFGRGTEKDEGRAVELYQQAAELGDTEGMCKLARCFENGVGVEINIEKAIEWYQVAADNGDELGYDALERLKED